MQILSFNFLMYTIGGIWRPIEWCSKGTKMLYSIFTASILSSLYFLMLTQFMDIVLVIDNMDDFTMNSFIFVTIIAVCCKATVIVLRRNAIIKLTEILLKEPCKPRDADEVAIQRKVDEFIKSMSRKYLILILCSLISLTIGSVLNVMHGYLPYKVWLPYNFNISLIFWLTSMQQMITIFFGTFINIGTETLIFGFILQTCAQIEIFQSRLKKLVICKRTRYAKHSLASSDKKEATISEYVRHHLSIYKYAKRVNTIFNPIFFVQFFSSILVLCTSIYYLSRHITNSGSATFVIYTIGLFVQIYVYCWSGNEVIVESTRIGDIVYHLDWLLLSASEKKDLLMIMMRSTIPIKFTSSFLITLSHQSYSNLLKTSYSAFNLLQQS